MPLVLRTDELQEGMRLGDSLMFNGLVMLPAGKILTARDIAAVRRRFPNVGLTVGDPVLDEVIDFEDDKAERTIAKEAQKKIVKAMEHVKDRFNNRTDASKINFKGMADSVNDVMQYIRDNPVSSALISRSLDSDGYLSEHTGNVFYLSLVLGNAVKDYVIKERTRQTAARDLTADHAMDLKPLGLGAMFMDLGMYPIRSIFEKEGELSAEEKEMVYDHPNVGAEMLPDSISATARMIVRTHHENYDGNGYPRGIPSEKLHIFSRIVRICDSYDAATADRVFQKAKTPAKALWEMSLGSYRQFYDPLLMKVFRGMIQPFPIGSKLMLNDGRYAIVVKYNNQDAFDPFVIVAFDQQNKRIPVEQLTKPFNISSKPGLRFTRFGNEPLAYLYSTSGKTPAASRGQYPKTAFQASVP
ncbi:MAG: HD domain-containing protein [Phycisphaeraceae bacterium]|nr:HD domain-containing protein [Phycisphaeraceae bacterium]